MIPPHYWRNLALTSSGSWNSTKQRAHPKLQDAYDPKSAEHIKAGTYPLEEDMIVEMESVAKVFWKIWCPGLPSGNHSQLQPNFARDIAFVIDDKFVIANILEDRSKEIDALEEVIQQIDPSKIIEFPEHAHIEGGDVMPWNDYILLEHSRIKIPKVHYRPNQYGRCGIPSRIVSLIKSGFFLVAEVQFDPKVMHCIWIVVFSLWGKGKAIIHKEGF